METPEQYTVKTPLTLQEAKDKAAQNHEFSLWDSLCKMLKRNGVYEANIGVFHDEATGIYSSELIKENERLRGTIGVECVKQLIAAREENKLYREALTRIRYPMKYLQQEADREGNQLDGNAAFQLSNAPSFLKSIAEEALSKFQPKKDESHDATIKAR